MFWRFGFHNASSIDTLLDRDDVALEDILDEDDLLQECKAQNTRLIDYFQRLDVLQRLLGYVTGAIEGEDKGRFKFPYVATEVLCSEIWSIVEACVTNSEQLLAPFWEVVLDRTPDDMRTRMAMAAHFAKINGVFMNKKPAEMLKFIQSQSSVVERLIQHVETPPVIDLLFRIIQLDEHPSGDGVLEWLASEKLIPRLVDLLSPTQPCEIHLVAADVIKGIITMSAPSPGASALNDGLQHVPASNRFARELASRENISKLLRYMLDDVPLGQRSLPTVNGSSAYTPSNSQSSSTVSSSPEEQDDSNHVNGDLNLPNAASATSSVVNSISVIIELIRKNNSDYFEPYLFHNLRNRLIQVQQQLHMQSEDGREVLERAMRELVDRMGVVHLGAMLEIMCERLDGFQELLERPRSLNGPLSTTVGVITPLTIERFRICELYAELLHCSNMALLNRTPGTGPAYDEDGRLLGGLSALEELARVISIGNGENNNSEEANGDAQEMVEAKELPIHSSSAKSNDSLYLASDSDSDLSDQSSDEILDEITVAEPPEPSFPISSLSRDQPLPSMPPEAIAATVGESSRNSNSSEPTLRPNTNSREGGEAVSSTATVGDSLKQRFMDMDVISTLLNFFFQFPWNNFLHGTVYDLVHQILTGRIDGGLNRELIIALFRDARLLHRIVEGHEENVVRSRQPKGVRLGYMGHLTLISEDVISALEHYPEELAFSLRKYAPQPAWDHYVNGGYRETRQRDTSLLGGGKPVVAPGTGIPKGRWAKVDEEDTGIFNGASRGSEKVDAVGAVVTSALTGEFRRMQSSTSPTNTADFGPSQEEEDSAGPSQFARYLAEEIHATPSSQFTNSSSSDDEDDDDDGGGWLARSSPYELGQPSTLVRSQHEVTPSGFNDPFIPSGTRLGSHSSFSDSFNFDDDDAFGPFSDVTAPNDPFTLSDQDDSPFDFGDFQAAEGPSDGEMTPTAGSWTFEDSSSDGLSFSGLSKDETDLRETLEAASLKDNQEESALRETHSRSPSIGQ
ncbi:SAPS-domain-containing protein [Ramaria rubella]|nr:SAPS-domain-containing protein [Ramaria rubella]